jgi:hypothetical protein
MSQKMDRGTGPETEMTEIPTDGTINDPQNIGLTTGVAQPAGLRKRVVGPYDMDFSDDEDDENDSERTRARKKWKRRMNKVWGYMNAAFWVLLAVLVIYWTNFFRVIWEHPNVHRSFFFSAMACLGFSISLIAYISLIKYRNTPDEAYKLQDNLQRDMPFAIPAITICGVATFFLFNAACWDVWGFLLTSFIQFSLFMGFLNASAFLPRGWLGSFLLIALFFGAWFTSELIPHEGLAHQEHFMETLAKKITPGVGDAISKMPKAQETEM